MILPESSRKNNEPRPTSSGVLKESALMAIFHRMRGIRSAEDPRGGREARSPVSSRGKLSKPVATEQRSFERVVKTADDAKAASASHGSFSIATSLLVRLLSPKTPIPASDNRSFDVAQWPRMPAKHEVPPNTPVGFSCQTTDSLSAGPQAQPNKRLASPGETPSVPMVRNVLTSQVFSPFDHGISQSLHDQDCGPSSRRMSDERGINGHMRQPSSILSLDSVFSESLRHSSMHTGTLCPPGPSESDSPFRSFSDGPHRSLDHDLDHDDAVSSDADVSLPDGDEAGISPRSAVRDESFAQGCFADYKLSLAERASALTIELPQAAVSQPNLSASSLLHSDAHPDRVHVWSDETEHHFTAMEELVYDLGYLGDVIT